MEQTKYKKNFAILCCVSYVIFLFFRSSDLSNQASDARTYAFQSDQNDSTQTAKNNVAQNEEAKTKELMLKVSKVLFDIIELSVK